MKHRTATRCARRSPTRLDFFAIDRAALAVLPTLLRHWLPSGRIEANEYVALNPRRADQHHGSFKINLRTGRWADFACNARGGDPVSLFAYLSGLSQAEAAVQLATMLNVRSGKR